MAMECNSSTAHKRCNEIGANDEPPAKKRKKNASIKNDHDNIHRDDTNTDEGTVITSTLASLSTSTLDELDLLTHETDVIKTSDDHKMHRDIIESDKIDVQIGDKIESFEISLLKQFAYFEARLDKRWTNNDKKKRNIIVISHDKSNTIGFDICHVKLLFDIVQCGKISLDYPCTKDFLDSLVFCSDFFTMGKVVSKEMLIDYLTNHSPPINYNQRKQLLLECKNELVCSVLNEMNDNCLNKVSKITSKWRTNVANKYQRMDDETLIDCFKNEFDFHWTTKALVFDSKTKTLRIKQAKKVKRKESRQVHNNSKHNVNKDHEESKDSNEFKEIHVECNWCVAFGTDKAIDYWDQILHRKLLENKKWCKIIGQHINHVYNRFDHLSKEISDITRDGRVNKETSECFHQLRKNSQLSNISDQDIQALVVSRELFVFFCLDARDHVTAHSVMVDLISIIGNENSIADHDNTGAIDKIFSLSLDLMIEENEQYSDPYCWFYNIIPLLNCKQVQTLFTKLIQHNMVKFGSFAYIYKLHQRKLFHQIIKYGYENKDDSIMRCKDLIKQSSFVAQWLMHIVYCDTRKQQSNNNRYKCHKEGVEDDKKEEKWWNDYLRNNFSSIEVAHIVNCISSQCKENKSIYLSHSFLTFLIEYCNLDIVFQNLNSLTLFSDLIAHSFYSSWMREEIKNGKLSRKHVSLIVEYIWDKRDGKGDNTSALNTIYDNVKFLLDYSDFDYLITSGKQALHQCIVI